jgi:hypothetical protein
VTTSDRFLLEHARAANAAIHGLAKAVGTSVSGLPEPSTTYAAAASLEDLLDLRDNVQAALTELADRVNNIVIALADVASRPPINISVPVPEVNVTVPDRPTVIEFARDKDGRIVAAASTPVP